MNAGIAGRGSLQTQITDNFSAISSQRLIVHGLYEDVTNDASLMMMMEVPQRLPLGKKPRVAPASALGGSQAGPEQDLDDQN